MTVVDAGTPADQDEFWLFGYGSLIWKPPPHYDRRIPGWVTGYVRRFWQDHRGTPDAPGRVVTLIERAFWEQLTDHHATAPDRVWGVAYRIQREHVAEVKEYLDIREINGYTIHYTPFYPADDGPSSSSSSSSSSSGPIRTLVYIGTPDNDQFTGPQEVQALAEHIYKSEGPSGLNRDYLLSLEQALDELSPESGDEHVTDLSNRVRAIIASRAVPGDKDHQVNLDTNNIMRSPPPVNSQEQVTHHHEFRKVSSIDEQEETEKSH